MRIRSGLWLACMAGLLANGICLRGAQPEAEAERSLLSPRGAKPTVVRTIMPESYPGAIAVIFSSGPSLCFDPVRGGINYIWEGTGIDFSPASQGKVGRPAEIRGRRFYREPMEQPMRRGNPESVPVFRFKGYRVKNEAVVFHYQLDDCRIWEEMRPLPDGRGIIRRIHTGKPAETFWFLIGPQEEAVCSSPNGEWEGETLRVTSDKRGRFTLKIRRKETEE